MVGTAAVQRDAIFVEQLIDRGAVHLLSGHDETCAVHRGGQCDTPAIGVEHRYYRHHHVARRDAHGVAGSGDHGMQHIRTVRIDHALRMSRSAGGVAHAGRGIFVEVLPGEVAVDLADPCFIGHRIFQRCLWHVRAVGQHDVAFDRGQAVGELFQKRHEGEIGHHHAVLRVIDDPGDLIGKQTRIDGVIDRADPHDAVPGFEMPPAIPGKRRHAIAKVYPVAIQPLRDLQRARTRLRIGCAMHRPFDRTRNRSGGRGERSPRDRECGDTTAASPASGHASQPPFFGRSCLWQLCRSRA